MKLGITGGICCGKTTALEIFSRYGFETINLDEYVREALRGNERVKSGIRANFGSSCVDSGGDVLVKNLGKLIFERQDARKILEKMVYAEIDTLWTGDVTAPTAIEVPLLFENNLEGYFSSTICVYSPYAEQLSRSIVFRRWGDDELRKRMAAQLPMREKIRRADFAIGNCGTKLQFERQIQLLLEKVIAAAGK
ncbi:MAG: dephospho-CoA kinase [Puniceicoccales bacterium]|nr:dephospho-CoA kinase [Puniceicoccales bacterium]